MSKTQTLFVCSNCGEEYAKWQGKCDSCSTWNCLKEFKTIKTTFKSQDVEILALNDIKSDELKRIQSQINEFDRVLGGTKNSGIVAGSVILLGGDPGIGKSTLVSQVAAKVSNVCYISAEESPQQIKMRFDRLNLKAQNLKIIAQTDLESIIATLTKEKYDLVIVDSIQTVYLPSFPSTPGSIVQVRESALKLQQFAKGTNTPVIIVGHVTKEGTVAGPRTLEHLVDVVLYLEGERFQSMRILRGVKNRFGATDEIGVFEMTQNGLAPIDNPSKLFLDQASGSAGSCVTAVLEGTRAFLVEIQALTASAAYGYPQRRSSGYDLNRLQLIIAVLEQKTNLNFSKTDVFINVAGGLKIKEPSADVAVALSIISAFKSKPLKKKLCAFGEIGLTGEIRNVANTAKRTGEAKRLGYENFITTNNVTKLITEAFDV